MTSFILSSAITTFISTILSIWSVVCMWIIFKKAWRKWWESLIPVWNVYVLFKIAGKKWWFWILLLLPIVWIIVSLISWLTLRSSDINEYSSIYTIRNMCNRILWLLALILPLMAWITLPYWLTKKFGKSNWFYIGMLFLTPIFFWILAFNNDIKYEWVEFNENYNLKKWLLITLGISLFIWCCDAGVKYYQYKDYYDYFNNFEYDYNDSYNIDYEYNNTEIENYWSKLEQINCYTKDWILNNNPERDEYWEIINCYNEKWEEEWKWVSYSVDWVKNAEMNFKNGKYNWKVILFNTDWTVAVEGNYIDDEYIGNN
jgi:hypothetical protein